MNESDTMTSVLYARDVMDGIVDDAVDALVVKGLAGVQFRRSPFAFLDLRRTAAGLRGSVHSAMVSEMLTRR